VATRKQQLLSWGGGLIDITINKYYVVNLEYSIFIDDSGHSRLANLAQWGQVCELYASSYQGGYRPVKGGNRPDKDGSKYNRPIKGVTVDVYDVLEAFNVTCPALQHLIKKALCSGLRGHKTLERDLKDIVESSERALSMGISRQLNN
jgi:hypothetical protein